MMDDWDLLQTYAKDRSETAFAELVQRHLNWVYSAALRQVRDSHLAKDVTQAVFVLLARKADSLRHGTILSGWLFRTTRFVAARALRAEYRRKVREGIASAMMPTTSPPDDNEVLWNQLAPHLDRAVAALSKTDRTAILLRFYEQKPLREVGQQLGLSEDAAKKRVSRAIEKLRRLLRRRGAVLGGTALAVALAEQSVQAAPASLAAVALKSSIASTSPAAVLPHLVRETLRAWRLAKVNLVAGISAATVGVAILTVNTVSRTPTEVAPPTPVVTGVATLQPVITPSSPALRGGPTATNREQFMTVLWSFTGGIDGATPQAGLVQASDGYFYGTTCFGGANDSGTVFRISTDGKLTNLWSFTGGADGCHPQAGLVEGRDGNLYGTTLEGGTSTACPAGCGTVFRITTHGSLTSLYSFDLDEGALPSTKLVQDKLGSLYGTTRVGGSNALGTVFRMDANGSLKTLHSFSVFHDDGGNPEGGLVQGQDGDLYGTTSDGGATGHGTVYRITPNGELTILWSFTGGADGGMPWGGWCKGATVNSMAPRCRAERAASPVPCSKSLQPAV